MKCAILFALLAFATSTPLTEWRNAETYGLKGFWNKQPVFHKNEGFPIVQQLQSKLAQYPYKWTGVQQAAFIVDPIGMLEIPQEQTHPDYYHLYQGDSSNIIPIVQTHKSYQYLHEMPLSLQKTYKNMVNELQPSIYQQNYVAYPQFNTVEELSMKNFYSKLQNFVEEHNEQEVQSLIAHHLHWVKQLYYQQELIDQQMAPIESRLNMLHEKVHTVEYHQLQQALHQLQMQRIQLIRQQLVHQMIVNQLHQAMVYKQHDFSTHENINQKTVLPNWRKVWWY